MRHVRMSDQSGKKGGDLNSRETAPSAQHASASSSVHSLRSLARSPTAREKSAPPTSHRRARGRHGVPAAQQQRARAKIAEYERFIGERLQPDLLAAEEARARTQREIAQWEGLVANARGLQERGQEELRTMVDLGSQVYCQAEVPDTSRLFVAVGLGFHAEMTLVRATTASLAHLPTAQPHERFPDPSSSCQPQDEAVAFAETKLERLREDEKHA